MCDNESSVRQYKQTQITQWKTIDIFVVAAAAASAAVHVYECSWIAIIHMNEMEKMSELHGNWVDIEKNHTHTTVHVALRAYYTYLKLPNSKCFSS